MGTRGGIAVDLLDPDPQSFDPETVARTLANEHRYCGNYGPYSVAQHSVLVAWVVKKHLNGTPAECMAALHHDDTEAVTGDLPKPVKRLCPDFQALEARLSRAIDARYLINTGARIVKEADQIVFVSEVTRLVPPEDQWIYVDDLPEEVKVMLQWTMLVPWSADVAFARYMDLHEELEQEIDKETVTDSRRELQS